MTSLAASGRCSRTTTRCSYPIGPNLSLEASPSSGKRVSGYLFVDMDRLRVLAKVVKTGEAASTMALKGPFTSVFPGLLADFFYPGFSPVLPYMSCEMLAACEAQITRWKLGAEESLPLLFLRWSARFTVYALSFRTFLSFI